MKSAKCIFLYWIQCKQVFWNLRNAFFFYIEFNVKKSFEICEMHLLTSFYIEFNVKKSFEICEMHFLYWIQCKKVFWNLRTAFFYIEFNVKQVCFYCIQCKKVFWNLRNAFFYIEFNVKRFFEICELHFFILNSM